jgi:hypothetical protein
VLLVLGSSYAYALYLSGVDLIDAKKEMAKALEVTYQTKQEAYIHWCQILCRRS